MVEHNKKFHPEGARANFLKEYGASFNSMDDELNIFIFLSL